MRVSIQILYHEENQYSFFKGLKSPCWLDPILKSRGLRLAFRSALSEHFSIYHVDIPVCFDDEEIYYQSNSEFSNFEAIRNLLQGYAQGEHNFSGINLIGAPMSGVNLPNIDLSQSILAAIDLQSSKLQGTDFTYANLREANLHGANLSHADLRGADLSDADLSHALLVGAKLYGAFVTGTNFTGANFRDTLLG